MKEPLLSIVIISYENSSLVLQRAIQSVYEQSYHNHEIIVVDANESGSDYSAGLREDMEAYPDISVIACPSKNGEFAAAKNQGAAQANGTYLAFLMGDDAWNPEYAASQIEVLEERPDVALVFCNRWVGNGDILTRDYKDMPKFFQNHSVFTGSFSDNPIHSVSQVMFRRTCFEEMCGFDTRIRKQDEYDMWLRLSKEHKIVALGENLVCSYVEKSVLKKSHKIIDVVGYLQLYSKHEELYKKNPEAKLELYRKIAESYKEENRRLTWLRYLWKIKMFEIKTGTKKDKKKKQEQLPENTDAVTVYQSVEQGGKEYIAVVKYCNDGSSATGKPEAGVRFQIYLKEAGSYDQARVHERDILETDDQGWAKSRALSQGVYVVCQMNGQKDPQNASEHEVVLERNGKTHILSLYSEAFSAYVKIICTDSETGKPIIHQAGMFSIVNGKGETVRMLSTYPEPAYLDIFSNSGKGYCFTPQKLLCGEYTLLCAQAPTGYVSDRTKVEFRVSKENEREENGISFIQVAVASVPKKGKIKIHKTGPVKTGLRKVTEEIAALTSSMPLERYWVEHEEAGVRGTIYEIKAEEDIVTADGTVRAAKGSIVATVITDENGDAVTAELYLGKYTIEEKTAAYGMVRNPEIKIIELQDPGAEVQMAEAEAVFEGQRQSGIIHLQAALGEDERFGVGSQGEIRDFVFGLFTAENIELSEGVFIPKDSLVELLQCDDDGKAESSSALAFGRYYVKEVSANRHYRHSEKIYPAEFVYNDQNVDYVDICINEGNAIVGELIAGNIHGVVSSIHQQMLGMAQIGLFSLEESQFAENNAFITAVSDWSGRFLFENIPCGDYAVRQIGAPAGYQVNEAVYYVSVTFDKQKIDLRIMNGQVGI